MSAPISPYRCSCGYIAPDGKSMNGHLDYWDGYPGKKHRLMKAPCALVDRAEKLRWHFERDDCIAKPHGPCPDARLLFKAWLTTTCTCPTPAAWHEIEYGRKLRVAVVG